MEEGEDDDRGRERKDVPQHFCPRAFQTDEPPKCDRINEHDQSGPED